MSTHFCVTIQLLHPVFHGRGLDNEPEWPPSPLRIFQALVAGCSWGQREFSQDRIRAFERLEGLDQAPILIAPAPIPGDGYRLSIPNNSLDKVAAAWSRGNYFGSGDASPAGHRTMKRVRPLHLPDDSVIHCLWPVPNDAPPDETVFGELTCAARRLISLGWGVDMVVGNGRLIHDTELSGLSGERWVPVRKDADVGLRVPVAGTLRDLRRTYQQFLKRTAPEGLPPEPLTRFRVVEYRRASDPAPRSVASFTLMRRDGGFRAFDPPRNTIRVAGMVRCAAKSAAEITGGWPDPASFVLGHSEKPGDKHQSVNNRRFAYLPLPSIQPHGPGRAPAAGGIRRVCVTVFEQAHEAEVEWARRTLPGTDLVRKETGEIAALLAPAVQTDTVLRRYLDPASEWASVSPVVLPGHDDPRHYRKRLAAPDIGVQEQRRLLDALHHRVEKLLRKAIWDAGFPDNLAAHAGLDWREAGFWPGTEKARNYTVPDHLIRFPRLHVRLRWRDALGNPLVVPGPICLGGGRFYGLGLFAAMEPGL